MIFDQKFIPHLLSCLKHTEYVLFEHFAAHKITPEIPFNFLLKREGFEKTIKEIQSFSAAEVYVVPKENSVEMQFSFKDGVSVNLKFWSQIAQNKINYLDTEQVLSKKQRSKSEFYMPNIEHLFEFAILSSFLNDKGLAPQYQSYFEDFHFFVRDGLLDFFNEKYSTRFSNLDDLSNFEPEIKLNIIESLKKMPLNHFFKRVNLQWLGFLAPRV